MSFWEVHLLVAWLVSFPIMIMFGIGFSRYRTHLLSQGLKGARFIIFLFSFFMLLFGVQFGLHYLLDIYNPVMTPDMIALGIFGSFIYIVSWILYEVIKREEFRAGDHWI